ncbi:amidohydrolase [Actinomadura sp. 3N407]
MTTTTYVNGAIYTCDPAREWASVLLVRDGVIISVGDRAELAQQIQAADEVVDLDGRMVMPGVHDAHTHLISGLNRAEVAFPPGADEDAIVAALHGWDGPRPVDANGNEWLIGGRYWPGAIDPHKAFLDEAFPDTPVMLHDRSAHNELLNSRALELAGINALTPDTTHGKIIRDASGEPTGELYEHARWPGYRVVGQHSEETVTAAIRWAVELNHRYGVTSLQDASSSAQLLTVLRKLDEGHDLNLHIAAHLVWREECFGQASLAELDEMIDHHADWASQHVDTRFVKFWLDGSPIPPYWTHSCVHEDGSVEREKLLIPDDELRAALVRFDKLGISVKIHCGGEGAIRTALDAIEYTREVDGPSGRRHELAHCGRVTTADFPRFAALKVGAEMSPAVWHIPEHNVTEDFYFDEVVAAGAEMTMGTDWSVSESPNLFPALQGALQHGRHSIDLKTALAALTINGARAVGGDDRWGSLGVGKSADFIVLDRNLFAVPVDEIGGTVVLQTVFEGRTVYEASGPPIG